MDMEAFEGQPPWLIRTVFILAAVHLFFLFFFYIYPTRAGRLLFLISPFIATIVVDLNPQWTDGIAWLDRPSILITVFGLSFLFVASVEMFNCVRVPVPPEPAPEVETSPYTARVHTDGTREVFPHTPLTGHTTTNHDNDGRGN